MNKVCRAATPVFGVLLVFLLQPFCDSIIPPCLCVFSFQVRKGFWKPPPQIWLGDASKVRVLDPHFLRQTAEKLLRIPLHPNSKQVREAASFAARMQCLGLIPR